MFLVNTIIAWEANIYRKNKDIITTTLLLPLKHIANRNLLRFFALIVFLGLVGTRF
jgi:hypothetical protein